MAGPQSPLVQKIRARYPEYDDIPDDELEQKILAKYPQYSDLASWAQNPTAQGPEQPFYDKLGSFVSNRITRDVDRAKAGIKWATSPSGGALPEGDKNAGGPLDLGLSPLKRVGQVLGIGRREEVPNIQGPGLSQIPGVEAFGEHAAATVPTSMAAASRTYYGGGPELSKAVLGFLATQDPRVVGREGGEPYVWDPPEGSFKYSRVPPEPGAPRVPVDRQLPPSSLQLSENAGAAPEPPPPPPVQPFSPVEPPPEAPITGPANVPPPAPRTQATVPPEIQAQIAVIQKAVQDGTLDRADGMLQITRLFMVNMKKTPVPPPVVKAEPTAPVSPFTDIKSTPPEQAQPPQVPAPQAAPAAPVEQPAMPAAPTPVAPPQATGAAPFSPVQDITNAPPPMAAAPAPVQAAPSPQEVSLSIGGEAPPPPVQQFSPVAPPAQQRPFAPAPEPPVQPFAPVQPAAPIAKIPPQVDPSAKHWMDQVEALDKIKAPDTDYRDILSSGARSKKKGETWRGKVLGYIALKNANYTPPQLEPEDSGEPVVPPQGETLSKYRIKTMPPEQAIRITNEDYAAGKITYDQAFHTMHDIQVAHDLDDMPEVKEPKQTPNLEPLSMRTKIIGPSGLPNIAIGPEGAQDMIKTLATSLYTRKPDVIASKELLQNSLDEHRIIGSDKPVRVVLNYSAKNPETGADANSVLVKDNGRGLKPDEIYTVFTDMGKSGKRSEDTASGGFGFAKASPLAGGKYVQIESIVKEGGKFVKYTFEGNPATLMDQKVGANFNKEVLKPPMFGVGATPKTGFQVEVFYDPKKTVFWAAEETIKNMGEQSPGVTSDVHLLKNFSGGRDSINKFFEDKPMTNSYDTVQVFKRKAAEPLVDTIDLPTATVNIHYNKPNENSQSSRYGLHILNKGMWQQSLDKGYRSIGPVKGVPKDITADVISKVEEGSDEYPFGLNREQLNEDIENAINEWISKNIISGALEKQKNQLQAIWDSMKPFNLPNTTRESIFFDPGDRLTPTELNTFMNSPVAKDLAQFTDNLFGDIVNAAGEQSWSNTLVRTGLFLGEQGHTGLHAPEPGKDKSSAMVNYFSRPAGGETPVDNAIKSVVTGLHEAGHIGDAIGKNKPTPLDFTTHPSYPKYIQTFLDQIQSQGGGNPGHEVDWLQRLGDIYATYGPARFDSAVDELHSIITDPGTGKYNAEFQKLLQIYKDSRGRPEVTEDIFSRTGVHEGPKSGGEGSIPSDARQPGKRAAPVNTPEEAVAKLNNAIQEAIELRGEQEASYTKERAFRIRRAAAVKPEKGEAGFYSRLSKMAGPYAKVDPGPALRNQFNQKDSDLLFEALMSSPNIDQFEKLHAGTGLLKLLNGDAIPQTSEIKLLDDAFGGQIEMLYGGLGAMGKVPMKIINEVVNLPKALMASVNFHAVLRQASPMMLRGEYWKSFGTMFRAYGSKKVWEGFKADLETRKYFVHPLMTDSQGNPRLDAKGDPKFGRSIAEKMGLRITDIEGPMSNREESFMAAAVGHIPLIAGSNRAYAIFLNKIRTDTFENMMEQAKAAGNLTPEMGRAIAKFINVGTGQGSLGKLEAAAVEMNMAFFSPRLKASMISMMNPMYYKNLPGPVRKEALKSLFAVLAFGTIVGGIVATSGAGTVDLNPTSADFGKIRIGNTRIDMYRGFQQIIVAAARLWKGEVTSSTTGETKKLGRFDTPTPLGLVAGIGNRYQKSYLENQASPSLGAFGDWASKRKIDDNAALDFAREMAGMKGETGDTPKVIANLVTPMYLNEILEIKRENPSWWKTSAMALPGLFGAGEMTYRPQPPKPLFNPTRGFSAIKKP